MAMPANSGRVLVVDDDDAYCRMLQTFLVMEGYIVAVENRADRLREAVQSMEPDLVVIDLHLNSDVPSWHSIERLCTESHPRAVILSTGDLLAVRAGAERIASLGCRVLMKPYDLDDLLATIREEIGMTAGQEFH